MRYLKIGFVISNCLFGAMKLTKNVYPDKHGYSSYGTGFDAPSQFLWENSRRDETVVNFGADISSYVNVDSKNKDILVLGEGPTQGLDDTTVTVEVKYPINLEKSGILFVLS